MVKPGHNPQAVLGELYRLTPMEESFGIKTSFWSTVNLERSGCTTCAAITSTTASRSWCGDPVPQGTRWGKDCTRGRAARGA
ncbi:MAG: hypothetical protein Ct9H300mP12_13020 [Acidimicrobiales bacterium]|nr:MAG: hypothetical protein Ct9H300mP12_13020 [Acidimicrobiales bacterium]